MLTKFLAFFLLLRLTGNPIVALIVLVVILYLLDRRFVGLTPNIARPFKLGRQAAKYRQELQSNPHNTSSKLALARILLEKKKYQEAAVLLEQTVNRMVDSAEVHYELGLCYLKLGDPTKGESFMLKALELNPRVKYGEPFLRLGEAYAKLNPEKAVTYIEQFRELQSSSCEAYYRLGQLYQQLGRAEDAKRAYREALDIYHSLPRYSRRQQRRWALLARMK